MRAQIFSDIHNDLQALRRLAETEADCYIAAGDLVSWGRGLEACGDVLKDKKDKVWVLPGNHESSEQIALFCARFGFRNFHGQLIEEGGRQFAGLGYSSPTPFYTPGEYTEDQLTERLQPFAGLERLILICHAPPFDTPLDRVKDGLHAGSRAVREFIEANRPEYFFCGHIHEAEGVETQIGPTRAVNVGKRGYVLEV